MREREDEGVVKNEKEKEKEMEVIVGSRGEDREERGSSGGENGNEETKK